MRIVISASFTLLCIQLLYPCVSATPPDASNLDVLYTFDKYVVDFDKSYDDNNEGEYQKRKDIFDNRMIEILRHNEAYFSEEDVMNRPGYFMNANHLMDLEISEIPKGFDKSLSPGWAANQQQITTSMTRDLLSPTASTEEKYKYEKKLPFECNDISTLPKEVDWRKKELSVITPPKDQGGCGACWAFGSVTALETQIAIKTHKLHVLSEEEPISCAKNPDQCGGTGGCQGAIAETAYEYISTYGIHTNENTPYEARTDKSVCPKQEPKPQLRGLVDDKSPAVYTMKGFAVLPANDEKCLMNAVAKHGSVAIAVDASHFNFYGGGIMDTPNGKNIDIDHLVVLEGYGTDDGVDYWLVRNSWGPNWGENGYIRIKRSQDCGYDTTPLNALHCKYKPDGNINPVHPVKVCGIAGVLYHSVIPIV